MSAAIFSTLNPEERDRLLGGATARSFPAGSTLLREGEPGSSLLLITGGRVEVSRAGATLATLQEGAALGEMALLDPAPRSATAVAKDAVTVLELDRGTLWGMLADGDSAAVKALDELTATVCERLAAVNAMVQEEVVRPRGNVFKRLWSSVWGK